MRTIKHLWNVATLLSVGFVPARLAAQTTWPVVNNDLQRTGYTNRIGPTNTDVVLTFPITEPTSNGAAIGGDGTVYVGSWDGNLYAISPDFSTLRWKFQTQGQIRRGPAIGPDGTVFVGSRSGDLFAVNPDGTEKWQFRTSGEVWAMPAPTASAVYFGSTDYNLYALNPATGAELWRFTAGNWIGDGAALMRDGTIVFGSWDGNAYALRPDGSLRWQLNTGGPVRSLPTIGMNDRVYVPSSDGTLYALDSNGVTLWQFAAGASITSGMATDLAGNIYFGAWNGTFYSLDSTGALRWSWTETNPGPRHILSGATIDGAGNVYFGSETSYMYSLDRNGQLRWEFLRCPDVFDQAGGYVAIGMDGTAYFSSDCPDTSFFAIKAVPESSAVVSFCFGMVGLVGFAALRRKLGYR